MNKSFLETNFQNTHTSILMFNFCSSVMYSAQKGDNSLCMKLLYFLWLHMPHTLLHLWLELYEPSNMNVKSDINTNIVGCI